jgi:hypothetical protein
MTPNQSTHRLPVTITTSCSPEQNSSNQGAVHKAPIASSRVAVVGTRVVIPSSAKVISYTSSNPVAPAERKLTQIANRGEQPDEILLCGRN